MLNLIRIYLVIRTLIIRKIQVNKIESKNKDINSLVDRMWYILIIMMILR